MKKDKMTVQGLASAMHKDYYFVRDELRRDSKRDIPLWPFATSKQGPTGRWSYFISRTRYEKWIAGELPGAPAVNYELIGEIVRAAINGVTAREIHTQEEYQ